MPLIIVEADEGRSIEQKRGLAKDITEAVCKNFAVPPEAVSILMHEGKKENRARAGKLAIDSQHSFSIWKYISHDIKSYSILNGGSACLKASPFFWELHLALLLAQNTNLFKITTGYAGKFYF